MFLLLILLPIISLNKDYLNKLCKKKNIFSKELGLIHEPFLGTNLFLSGTTYEYFTKNVAFMIFFSFWIYA